MVYISEEAATDSPSSNLSMGSLNTQHAKPSQIETVGTSSPTLSSTTTSALENLRRSDHASAHGDQTYKMYLDARGVYTGVNIEDWDDSKHVKDDTKLDVSNDCPRSLRFDSSGTTAPATSSPLHERSK